VESSGCTLSHSPERTTKGNCQGPLPDVSGSTPGTEQCKAVAAETSEQPGSCERPGTTRQEAEAACVRHFHRSHVYQQQLIEKQKKKLEQQQKTIQKLKENQRLAEARWAAKRAPAVTEGQNCLQSDPRGARDPQGTCQRLLKYVSRVTALGMCLQGFPLSSVALLGFLYAHKARNLMYADCPMPGVQR
jgi:hypothetical protein